MKYVGSKNRHAKEILPLILKDRSNKAYVEPFVGGFNCIDKVTGVRIGSDIHPYLIALGKALQINWEPPSKVSEDDYYKIKTNSTAYDPALVGFVGFCCSFSGKWWGGYARGKTNTGQSRNYAAEAKRNLLKQAPNLKGIELYNSSYLHLNIPDNSIIYCDPPYKHTVKYENEINHTEFWQWCREKESEGHKVFISEYSAPEDFKPIWSKLVNNTLDLNTGNKQGVEKLFIYAP